MKNKLLPRGALVALITFLSSPGAFAASPHATVYQAENATLSQAAFENTNAGYNGTGYGSYVIPGSGSVANQYIDCSGTQPTSSTPEAPTLTIPYSYTPDATSTVKNTVLTWAGFGKINP